LIIFSGFSALSTRSLRLARTSVETLSSSAMIDSFPLSTLSRANFRLSLSLGARSETAVPHRAGDDDADAHPDRKQCPHLMNCRAESGSECRSQHGPET